MRRIRPTPRSASSSGRTSPSPGTAPGSGQVRYDRAVDLLTGAALSGTLTHAFLLRSAARDLKNDVVDPYPLPYEGGQDGRPDRLHPDRVFDQPQVRPARATVFRGVLTGRRPAADDDVDDPRRARLLGRASRLAAGRLRPAPSSAARPRRRFATRPSSRKGQGYHLATSPEYIDTGVLDDGAGGGFFAFTEPIEDRALARAEAALQDLARLPADVSGGRPDSRTPSPSNPYWCFLASSVPNDGLSAPQSLAVRTLENRSLLLREYVHALTWQAPAVGTATAYRIYDVSGGGRTLLAEVPGGTTSYLRRRANLRERASTPSWPWTAWEPRAVRPASNPAARPPDREKDREHDPRPARRGRHRSVRPEDRIRGRFLGSGRS